jgi:arylsulfatase A-like enzyme
MFRISVTHSFTIPLLLIAAWFVTCSVSFAAENSPPNIVFIMADDLGYTDLGCFGSGYYETPHIDRLAAQGLRLTNYHHCQNCTPTRAALMSGQYGARTGVYTVGGIDRFDWSTRPLRPVDNVVDLPLDRDVIAKQLRAAGYATGMFGKWHIGEKGEFHPAKRGFDEAIVTAGKHFDFETNPKVEYPQGEYLETFLTNRAIDFIKRHQEKPFFLYLPHFGVHSPYQAKPEKIEHFKPKAAVGGHHDATYAAMISSVDESVGRVMRTLDDLKLSDNTILIFTSDNGGVGGYVREGIKDAGSDKTDNAPLRSGKGSLYEGGTRVPMIIRWPSVTKPGTKCDVPTIHVDMFPTLLEIASAPRPSQTLDGESLVPLFSNPNSKLKREAIFQHFPGYLGAGKDSWRTTPVSLIHSGDWKLMEFLEDNRLELYRLSDDIGESNNLAQERPDVAAELKKKLDAWRLAVNARMPKPNDSPNATDAKPKAKNKNQGKQKQSRALGTTAAQLVAADKPTANRPNVLVILGDDQGWGDYSFMGHPHIRTPRLDQLAKEGLTFTRGYVPDSLCRPSLATIISGLYPHQHGIVGNDPPWEGMSTGAPRPAHTQPAYVQQRLAYLSHVDAMQTMPDFLAPHGYQSFQCGKWWEGNYVRGGFTHGMTEGDFTKDGRHGDKGLAIGREGIQPIEDFLDGCQKSSSPFYLWYAPFLPHAPHNPPQRLLEHYQSKTDSLPIAKYWAMCEWFDESCGQVLDALDRRGMTENTMVLFVCDNGWINLPNASAYAPRSKRSPNEGGIRTPILVKWPAKVQPKRDETALVSSIDLVPTALAACGLAIPPELPGINLMDATSVAERKAIFGEILQHDIQSQTDPAASLQYRWVIRGDYKLIDPAKSLAGESVHLYHLKDDPTEDHDIASEKPGLVESLQQQLNDWWHPATS